MNNFEYDILTFPMTRKTSLADMKHTLNAKGSEGWEVIAVNSSEFSNIGHTAFLKRVSRAVEADS